MIKHLFQRQEEIKENEADHNNILAKNGVRNHFRSHMRSIIKIPRKHRHGRNKHPALFNITNPVNLPCFVPFN